MKFPRTIEVTVSENAYAWMKAQATKEHQSVEGLANHLIMEGIMAHLIEKGTK